MIKSLHQTRSGRRPGKLQIQLFRYYLILPILILVIFAVYFYGFVSNVLIQRELSSLETQITSIRTSVYNGLQDLDQISVNINFFNRKTEFFTEEEFNTALLNEYVTALNGTQLMADQINLYTLSGTAAQIGRVTRTVSYDASELEWFEDAIALSGEKIISTPYQSRLYSPGNTPQEWYLSVYRAATDKNRQVIGTIETMRRCKNLFRDISNYNRTAEHPATLCIFTDEGDLIYPYELTEEEKASMEGYYTLMTEIQSSDPDNAPQKVRDPVTGSSCRYILERSSYSGWNYFFLQEDKVILRPVFNALQILVSMTAAILLISILLSWILSRNMVKPVKHLKHVVQRVRLDTLGMEPVSGYEVPYEELNELYSEFEKMNQSLRKSLEELEHSRNLELQSRVLALQTQMNPHFYYNTLSCISVLAEDGQTEEVSNLCQNLSTIMRYITNTAEILVPVSDALDYVQRYLYCMKIRYQDSLNYEIRMDPVLLSEQVPKLVVQPLVENAVKYGTDCNPPWSIRVIGEVLSDRWTITVEDSGNGFTREALDTLRERLRQVDSQGDEAGKALKIGGLGLVNTYIRWKLFLREDAIFEFGNTPEGHAYTRIGKRI